MISKIKNPSSATTIDQFTRSVQDACLVLIYFKNSKTSSFRILSNEIVKLIAELVSNSFRNEWNLYVWVFFEHMYPDFLESKNLGSVRVRSIRNETITQEEGNVQNERKIHAKYTFTTQNKMEHLDTQYIQGISKELFGINDYKKEFTRFIERFAELIQLKSTPNKRPWTQQETRFIRYCLVPICSYTHNEADLTHAGIRFSLFNSMDELFSTLKSIIQETNAL